MHGMLHAAKHTPCVSLVAFVTMIAVAIMIIPTKTAPDMKRVNIELTGQIISSNLRSVCLAHNSTMSHYDMAMELVSM